MSIADNTPVRRVKTEGSDRFAAFFTGTVGIIRARVTLILLIAVALEIYARLFANPTFFPPLTMVARSLFDTVLADANIRAAVVTAIWQIAIAYGLSIVVGLSLGLAIGWTNFGRRATFPIVLLLYAIPQVVLLPLFVLGFGLGTGSKIAFGFSHGVFPILVNVIAGMRNVNQLYIRGAQSMGASRIELFRHVIFPHMVPSFFAGLRLGMTMTLLGVILAELYVSTRGIGYYTKVFAETMDPAPLYAIIFLLAVIAITFNEIVRIAERRFTRWKA
ncbi:ABC transporter permease [Mesorhizobium sp. CAU 1741]|uniref:ABC transporter permease n=1 Tax=Mesorhizobium sp. CAU 1741 TaxID=3140366 RepID=UPI00325BA810